MKTLLTYASLLLFILFSNFLFGQQYEWIKTGGTTQDLSSVGQNEASYFSTTDQNGNVYSLNIVGNNPITADTFYRSAAYSANNNILLTSYDCSGTMRWAKLIASSSSDVTPMGLKADSLGHIYICGIFPHGSFHIGYDTTVPSTLHMAGLIQFDTSGHFNWIRFIGPNTAANRTASAIASGALVVDGLNKVHFLKFFHAGSIITPTVTSIHGNYDITYDASGALLNAKLMQLDSTWQIYGGAIDKNTGKLFAYGYKNPAFSYNGNFVAGFDTGMTRLWMDSIIDITAPGAGGFNGISLDDRGSIYLCAGATGTFLYNGDTITNSLMSIGPVSSVIKTDTLGHLKWLRKFMANAYHGFSDITVAPGNKVVAVGTLVNTSTADGITVTSYSGEGQNAFFTILDTGGHVEGIQQIHGTGFYDAAVSVAANKSGNIFIGGQFATNISAGTIPAITSIGGNTDFFVLKYGVSCTCTGVPVASFTYSGSPFVTFTYTGTTSGIDSVRWQFGDGGTSTSFSPTHNYTAGGTYTVRVDVYSPCGSSTFFATIVIACVTTPVSSFSSTGISATRGFSYTGTPAAPDSIAWTFGDGGHALGLTTSHTYLAAGTYNVCATVYTPCGTNVHCNTITITCLSTLAPAYTHIGYSPVSFTYTGTTTGMDSVVWHYGDGSHATGLSATHTYAAIGLHTACVLVYNHCGVDSFCNSFSLPCVVPPAAAFTSTGTTATRNFTYAGTTVALDSVVWNFGDGGHSVGLTAAHTYLSTGSYNVCVTAYSPCGSNSFCSLVTIGCVAAPAASFTSAGSPNITFSYTGSTAALDSVVWHFGDGSNGTGATTAHLYAVLDTYTVCAIAYTACGSDSICSTVIVTCPTPVAAFTHSGLPTVVFNYTGTTPAIDSIVWNFGDGTTDTGISASHGFAVTDTYNVCVIVYTPCGSDTICSEITAIGLSISSFALNNINLYPNPSTNEVNITGLSNRAAYKLRTITGAYIQEGVLQKGANTIHLGGYALGIYVIEIINTDGNRTVFRVIKQ